jgi:long-chain acyl-CoA synthetase
LANLKQIKYKTDDELLKIPEIEQHIQQVIDVASVDLASYETIKSFRLKKVPFSIESGELTPSLKIKRNVVEKTYKNLINEMYPED